MFLGERVFSTINAARMTLSLARVRLWLGRLPGAPAQGRRASDDGRARARSNGCSLSSPVFGARRSRLAFVDHRGGREALAASPRLSNEARRQVRDHRHHRLDRAAHRLVAPHPLRRARALPHAPRREHRRAARAVGRGRGAHARRSPPRTARSSRTPRASSTTKPTSRTFARRAPANRPRTSSRACDEPVKVTIFFPQLNDVGREVAHVPAKSSVAASPKFAYEVHDRLLEPALAKDWKVTQDGVIVLARGPTQETHERRHRHGRRARPS